MIDIHCHLLPGLDDGPDSLEEAVQMAEMAIADGITHVVATPHASETYRFAPDVIRARRDELQARFNGRLTIVTGCDFHLSFENLERLRQQPENYTINQKDYLLVEFPAYGIPPATDQALHALRLAGLHPIITHPERNPLIRANFTRVDGWIRQGCYLQVTGLSLLGGFGTAAQRAAEAWLDGDRVHFVASDAHNVSSRPPRLRQAYSAVVRRRGPDVARALFHDNPLAALEGRPLPYVPEPTPSAEPPRRRKRFFFF